MLAKDLAALLLEHPDYTVEVGVMELYYGSPSYTHVDVEERLIDVDEHLQTIYLGD